MPELHFAVRWPDGRQQRFYSPSTVVWAHFSEGDSYSVPEFVARARVVLALASERVRAKYGYECSSAMDTLRQIEEAAARFADRTPGTVEIVEVEDPRPTRSSAFAVTRRRRSDRDP